jgi:hypothetical protein
LHLTAKVEFELPLVEREQMMAELNRLISPLLAELQGNLQACGQLRLCVQFDDGSTWEKTRAFLHPIAQDRPVLRTLGELLDGLQGQGHHNDPDAGGTAVAISGLVVTLEQIQDPVAEQLSLFSFSTTTSFQEIQRYLASRFSPPGAPGVSSFEGPRLRRAVMSRPGAPLPEWRIDWLDEAGPRKLSRTSR